MAGFYSAGDKRVENATKIVVEIVKRIADQAGFVALPRR
jgi:hypothetical protein